MIVGGLFLVMAGMSLPWKASGRQAHRTDLYNDKTIQKQIGALPQEVYVSLYVDFLPFLESRREAFSLNSPDSESIPGIHES